MTNPGLSGGRAMLELAERCEKATGANKVLDEAIYEALAIIPSREHSFVYPHYAYTASIDAALSLVPEGWRKRMIDADNGRCICEAWHDDLPHEDIGVQAATWPLTLCAAALRARAADTPSVKP